MNKSVSNWVSRGAKLAVSKVALLALAAGLQAQSFDLADSFSATANPNGPWAYGWSGTVGGVFTAITVPFV